MVSGNILTWKDIWSDLYLGKKKQQRWIVTGQREEPKLIPAVIQTKEIESFKTMAMGRGEMHYESKIVNNNYFPNTPF